MLLVIFSHSVRSQNISALNSRSRRIEWSKKSKVVGRIHRDPWCSQRTKPPWLLRGFPLFHHEGFQRQLIHIFTHRKTIGKCSEMYNCSMVFRTVARKFLCTLVPSACAGEVASSWDLLDSEPFLQLSLFSNLENDHGISPRAMGTTVGKPHVHDIFLCFSHGFLHIDGNPGWNNG